MKASFSRIIILILLSYTTTMAQDTFSFEQCVKMAMEHNLQIYKQKNQQNIYQLNIKKAQNARLPSVSGSLSDNLNWGRGIDPYTNTYVNQQFSTYNGGLSFDLNLFNGFYHINNIKLQKQALEANRSEWQKIKNDLTIDIAMRYTNILYLQEMIRNIQIQLANSQYNIDYTQKKIDAGALAKKEIYKAIAQRDNESLNLITTENTLEINKMELKQLIMYDINKDIQLLELPTITPLAVAKTDYMAQALHYNPMLKIAQNNITKSNLNLQLSKSNYYPTVSIGGQLGSAYSTFNKIHSLGQQLDNNFSYGLRINAQIPIFSQFQTQNKVSEAQYNIQSAEIQYGIEKQNQYKIINKAYLDWTSSQKKLETSTSALKSNQINYETELVKYEAGRINLQELNISKTNLFSSTSNNIKDKYEMMFNILVTKILIGQPIVK